MCLIPVHDEFSGLWTKEETAAFKTSVKREVDPEDWK